MLSSLDANIEEHLWPRQQKEKKKTQKERTHQKFPFFSVAITNLPAQRSMLGKLSGDEIKPVNK